MSRILIVDDEERIRAVIRKYAEFEGYETEEAENGMQAVEICRNKDFDVMILDIMMPELDGFSTCRKIFEMKKIPTIMLSARGEEYDKIHGFELGIDDYVVKPFSPRELMMRVKVVLSRNAANTVVNSESEREVFKIDGLEVDFTGRKVTIDGKAVSMTPKEYDLLFYMVRNRGTGLGCFNTGGGIPVPGLR